MNNETRPPLDGLLVADFSRVLAGPLATMMLADLGAEVIKIERPGTGDDTRQWGPPWTDNSSSYFESVNRSKSSMALDLNDPADHATAVALALRADVLVENFQTGKLDALGLGYAELSARNPRLIYCSITGFGSAAGAELPGYDFVVQAMGGLMSITGERDGDPMKTGVAVVDVLTGKDAVIAILAAVTERHRSGRRPARRGQSALFVARIPGQPGRSHSHDRHEPDPIGQSASVDRAVPSSPVPGRAAGCGVRQ